MIVHLQAVAPESWLHHVSLLVALALRQARSARAAAVATQCLAPETIARVVRSQVLAQAHGLQPAVRLQAHSVVHDQAQRAAVAAADQAPLVVVVAVVQALRVAEVAPAAAAV